MTEACELTLSQAEAGELTLSQAEAGELTLGQAEAGRRADTQSSIGRQIERRVVNDTGGQTVRERHSQLSIRSACGVASRVLWEERERHKQAVSDNTAEEESSSCKCWSYILKLIIEERHVFGLDSL